MGRKARNLRNGLDVQQKMDKRANLAEQVPNVGVSALRGLASAGYFTPEELSAMEGALYGRKKDATPSGKQWLSLREASKYSTLSRASLWKHAQLGRLTIHRIGRRSLVERSELDAFLAKGQGMAWMKRKRKSKRN